MNNCIFCDRIINNKGSLISHQNTCNNNPNRVKKKSGRKKGCIGQVPWNKGLTSETDERIKQHAKTLSEKYKNGELNRHCTPHTDKTKLKLSIFAKKRKLGGYIRGSGRGKKGWYKGFFCDSSWELAYVLYCLDNNIHIIRNIEKRQYEWKGTIKNYIPDFVVEGTLIEIKGYSSNEWQAKLAANPDVKVLYKLEMTPILEYVKTKYGKNFINLYE